jgi:hypothetical protein
MLKTPKTPKTLKNPLKNPPKNPLKNPKNPLKNPKNPPKNPLKNPKNPLKNPLKNPKNPKNSKTPKNPNKTFRRKKIKGGNEMYNNIIIYIINNINNFIEKKEIEQEQKYRLYMEEPPSQPAKHHIAHDISEDIPSISHKHYNEDIPSMGHMPMVPHFHNYDNSSRRVINIYMGSKNIIIPLSKFILCFLCNSLPHLNINKIIELKGNTLEIIEIMIKICNYMLEYLQKKIDIDELMDNLENIIPCINKFKDAIKSVFIIFYTNIKNFKLISRLKNIIQILLRNTYNYSANKILIYKDLLKYRYICSKNFFNNLLNNIYNNYHGKNNKIKQKGGSFIHTIKIKEINIITTKICNSITSTQIYNLFKTIKDYSADELKDVMLNDISENDGDLRIKKILILLYIYKYTINFILKTILYISVGDTNLVYNFLDFLDSCITLFIVFYLLNLENIIQKIIEYIISIIPDRDAKYTIQMLLQFIFIHQGSTLRISQCDDL